MNALDELAARFRVDGLPVPTLDGDLELSLRSDWYLTSRDDQPAPPYQVADWTREFEEGEVDDYVVLAHDGHGANSWAVSYYVVRGSVGVFVKADWGGAYDDEDARDEQARLIGERFRAADRLLASEPRALGDRRLLVVDADFGRRGWAVLGPDGSSWHDSTAPFVDALPVAVG